MHCHNTCEDGPDDSEWPRINCWIQNLREAEDPTEIAIYKKWKSQISDLDKWGPSARHLQLIGMHIPPLWLTNPPTHALPHNKYCTLRHKYIHCLIQIHSLWCTNLLLWGTNPGNWIRLMKTSTTHCHQRSITTFHPIQNSLQFTTPYLLLLAPMCLHLLMLMWEIIYVHCTSYSWPCLVPPHFWKDFLVGFKVF